MRWIVRIAVALGVLVVLAVAALAVALPRLARSDAVRARIEAAARDATGQPLRWEDLSFGLLPPRLVVDGPRLGGNGEPVVAAERVDLRVALLPLLARAIVVDSLRVDGVTVKLVRTKDGIELPGISPSGRKPAGGGGAEKGAEPGAGEAGAGLALAVRELELTQSHLVLVDRTVTPPVTWDVQDLQARARGRALDAPLDLDIDGRLASGGRVRVAGTAGLDGMLDLRVRLDGVALGPLAPYLPDARKLTGTLTGTVEVKGPAAAPQAVKADLVLDEADVALRDIVLRGRLAVKADVAGGAEGAFSGPFEIDATAAELAYGEAFRKPAGTTATATGRLVPGEGGALGVTDLRVRMRNLDATGRLSTGPRTRIEVDAAPFELDGWEALLPALAELRPTGRLAFEKLAIIAEPSAVRGRIVLAGVKLRRADVPEPIQLDGALVGEGDRLRSEGLEVRVGGEPVAVALELAGLATSPTYAVRVSAKEVEANRLAAALAGKRDVIEGPLTAEADLRGPLGGEVVRTVRGNASLAMGKGRLRGVSLLRATFERLGAFGEAALIAGALRGGRTLQRFYGDEFESITGTFRVGDGLARTDDLKLVYRHYKAELRGSLGLADGSLDFTGRLVISEEVDAALVQAAAEAGTEPPAPQQKVIPLARVRGTVSSPRIDLSPPAVVAFVSSFAVARRRQQVEKKLDEALGEGTGKQVIDVLEGILGGGRRPSGQ